MSKYWIGVASEDHVKHGVTEGFCQLCHGKSSPLKKMKEEDWIIYYSPKESLNKKTPCQKFTAIGQILSSNIYQVEMYPGFQPYKINVIKFVGARHFVCNKFSHQKKTKSCPNSRRFCASSILVN